MRIATLLLVAGLIGCDPPDTETGTDTGADTDPGETDPPAPVPGDRLGVTGGGATGVSGGGYRLNVAAGDAFAVHERTDGTYRLRLGVGTTQDRTP